LPLNNDVLNFLKHINSARNPIPPISHRPQILITPGLLKPRTITSYPPLHDHILNAAPQFNDDHLLLDPNFITS
uniref:DJ-1/PfpI family protein n=1 Tax=Geobacillus sp. (strain Y412MC10) TaxID=481743 RepID=UPI001643153F